MKRVVIESPLKGNDGDYITNRAYAQACWHDSLNRGEAPYASHLFIAQPGLLDDKDEAQRKNGIACELAWGETADLIAVYIDRGISDGMRLGIEKWTALGIPIEERSGIAIEQDEPKRELTSREIFLQSLAAEPEGTRIFALIIDSNGHLAQLLSGGFHIWELQGIIAFLGVQLEIAAANSLVTEDAPDSDVKSPDRVM